MKHPIFHPDEEARIGPYASDEGLRGSDCKIVQILPPICGEYRYLVATPWLIFTTVLESTLRKRFERSDWGMLRGIWQPKREAR